jgi:hypothetical protein
MLSEASHHQSCANSTIDYLTAKIKKIKTKGQVKRSSTWGFLWTEVTVMPLMISEAQRRERRSG